MKRKNVIERFVDSLKAIPDKLLHFIMGYLIFSVSLFIIYQTWTKINNEDLWAFAVVWVAAIGKEVRDMLAGDKFDVEDMAWTILGACPMFSLVNFLYH